MLFNVLVSFAQTDTIIKQDSLKSKIASPFILHSHQDLKFTSPNIFNHASYIIIPSMYDMNYFNSLSNNERDPNFKKATLIYHNKRYCNAVGINSYGNSIYDALIMGSVNYLFYLLDNK